MKISKIINEEDFTQLRMYIKPETKLRLKLKDKELEKFTHLDKEFITFDFLDDYNDEINLVFKDGIYCHLSDIESIEILED